MRIAIVGNRKGWTYKEVCAKLKEYNVYKSDIIISGGADGVDTYAQQYAKEIGAKIEIFYPDPNKPNPERYYHRNREIVLSCDILIAFNRHPNARSGTTMTTNYAKTQKEKGGRPIQVIVIE